MTTTVEEQAKVDTTTPMLGHIASVALPVEVEAVHLAREWLGVIFDAWGLPERENAQLCLSELASNVVRHAKCDMNNFYVDIATSQTQQGDRVRVSVHDHSTKEPEVSRGLPEIVEDDKGEIMDIDAISESGNGLFLVSALANEWGYHIKRYSTGKVVWFSFGWPGCTASTSQRRDSSTR
jgi:anti-sigma regulatory factor (Ser/Thr protein kinase)